MTWRSIGLESKLHIALSLCRGNLTLCDGQGQGLDEVGGYEIGKGNGDGIGDGLGGGPGSGYGYYYYEGNAYGDGDDYGNGDGDSSQ